MKFEEFQNEVKKLVTPEDYAKSSHYLFAVMEPSRNSFINLIQRGANIYNAIQAVGIIEHVTKETHLTQEQFLKTFTCYNRINQLIQAS